MANSRQYDPSILILPSIDPEGSTYPYNDYRNLNATPWVSCVKNENIQRADEIKPTWFSRLPFKASFKSQYPVSFHYPSGDESSKPSNTILDTKVASSIIKHLTTVASENLGTVVNHTVLTVPAWFNDTQRDAAKEAGAQVYVKVLRVVNEPTAAALAYNLDSSYDIMERFVVVVDMGGNILDVATIAIEEGVFEIHGVAGDKSLGGNTLNKMWLEHILANSEKHKDDDVRKVSGHV